VILGRMIEEAGVWYQRELNHYRNKTMNDSTHTEEELKPKKEKTKIKNY
jgi:hypothetical protein